MRACARALSLSVPQYRTLRPQPSSSPLFQKTFMVLGHMTQTYMHNDHSHSKQAAMGAVVVQAVSPHLSRFSLSPSLSPRARATQTQTHAHTQSLVLPSLALFHAHTVLPLACHAYLLSLALHTCMHNDESHLQQAAMEAVDMRAVCPSPPPSSLSLFSPSLFLPARARSRTHTHTHRLGSPSLTIPSSRHSAHT